jgi:hypothetical protein
MAGILPLRCRSEASAARTPAGQLARAFEPVRRLVVVLRHPIVASSAADRQTRAARPAGRQLKTMADPAYELGPASKLTLSTSSEAFLRYLAMFSSGNGSGLSLPQLCTIAEGATFGFTGYSLLALA